MFNCKLFTCLIRTWEILTEFDLAIKAYGLDPGQRSRKMDLYK